VPQIIKVGKNLTKKRQQNNFA